MAWVVNGPTQAGAPRPGRPVVVEAPRVPDGHDALTHVTVGHDDSRDWNAEVDGWVRRLVEHRASSYGDPHSGASHHGHHSGPGVGTAVAAGAAGLAVGVAGGLVAAEVVDEVGDFFEGEEGEEDEEE